MPYAHTRPFSFGAAPFRSYTMKTLIHLCLLGQLIFAIHLCANEVSDCVIHFDRTNESGDDQEEVTLSGKAAVVLRDRLKEIYETAPIETDEDRSEATEAATDGLGNPLDENEALRYHVTTDMYVSMVYIYDEDSKSREEPISYYISINSHPEGDYIAIAHEDDDNPHKLSYKDALMLRQAGLDLHLDLEFIYGLD